MSNDRILNLTYGDLSPYTYDTAKIMSNGARGLLKLINNIGLIFEQDFSSDTGFTYNNLLAEFTGGQVRGKDQRPSGAMIAATFAVTKNLSWDRNGGNLSGVDVGSPVLNNGYLDLLGYGNISRAFTNPDLGLITNQGSIRIKYKSPYNNTPAQSVAIYELSDGVTNNNKILMSHNITGNIIVHIYNSAGTVISSTSLGGYSFPLNSVNEILLCWNTESPSRVLYLLINGTLISTTTIGSMARTGTATTFKLGTHSVYGACNCSIKDVILYNYVLYTTGYTAGYTVPEAAYLENKIRLPLFTYSGIGSIQALDTLTISEVDSPKWILDGYYHNGSAWVVSDGSYAKANDYATLNANKGSFVTIGKTTLQIDAVLPTSNTQASISDFNLSYTGQKYSIDTPSIIKTIGTYLDGIGAFTVDAILPIGTSLKFCIVINNVPYYWNGTAWATSSGLFAQSNTLAELNTNIGSFNFALGKIFQLKVFLVTTDDQKTPELTAISMTYDFAVNPSYPQTCKMWGFLVDDSGLPLANATITFSRADGYSGNNLILKSVKATSDLNGYYEKNLIIGSEVTETVVYTDENNQSVEYIDKFTVPNEVEPQPIAENLVA